MNTYLEFYERVIHEADGLKLVPGGTGLGKTSNIAQLVRAHPERKFVYVANRLQLLREMEGHLAGTGFCAFQKRDLEILLDSPQPDVEALLRDERIANYDRFFQEGKSRPNLDDTKKSLRFLNDHLDFRRTSTGEEMLSGKAREVLKFFKKVVLTAGQISRGEIKGFPEYLSQRDFTYFVEHKVLRQLFPYFDFKHNPERRILLVTLQKAFHGFFDGRRNVNLNRLENTKKAKKSDSLANNGGLVIFFDEFDFLENDLLTLLAEDTVIAQPFEFTERFFTKLTRDKLPHRGFLERHPLVREKIEQVVSKIRSLSNNYGIRFPEINHFVCSEPKLKNAAIFQTRYSLFEKPILLDDNLRENSFTLRLPTSGERAQSLTLLNVVNEAVLEIVYLFKELEFNDPDLYRALLNHCFASSSSFQQQLRQIKQHPQHRRKADSNYDKLHINGFGLYEIHSPGYVSDPDEVELRYYALFHTPETVLLNLCRHNLVFGLSATVELPRLVRNFDTAWLRHELRNRYLETTPQDLEGINQANIEKQAIRKNHLAVEVADIETISRAAAGLIKNFVKINQRIFGKGEKHAQRKKRLLHFFSTLDWTLDQRREHLATDTHLVFFSSFKQIKALLEDAGFENPDDDILLVKRNKTAERLFPYYEITYRQQQFIIVFFDAAKAREIRQDDRNQAHYWQLFWQQKPVILITTYPSAGNGVNLQYYPDQASQQREEKRDFNCLHLLDSPYFYFGKFDPSTQSQTEQDTVVKTNIYYLSKLEKGKSISEGQFKQYLGKIRHIGQHFNSLYLRMSDGVMNQTAAFIQAIGRFEREWRATPNQTLRLDPNVYQVLEKFAVDPDPYFAIVRRNMQPFYSNNLRSLFEFLSQNADVRTYRRATLSDEGLAAQNEKCRIALSKMLDDHERLRLGMIRDPERANQIRYDWQKLRRLALRHTFFRSEDTSEQPSLLYRIQAVYATEYLYSDGKIYFGDEMEIVPAALATHEHKPWDLNAIYSQVRGNTILRGWFELQRYELRFNTNAPLSRIFVPYFHQSILTGAVGEECVKAVFAEKNVKISLNDDEIPDALFELADTKVQGLPIFIDCKYYGEHTLTAFPITDTEDPAFHDKLNETHFKIRALKKLALIRAVYPGQIVLCKLVFINAFGDNDRPIRYFDDQFNDLGSDFNRASIIVIPGMVERSNADDAREDNELDDFNQYCRDFKDTFIPHLQKFIQQWQK